MDEEALPAGDEGRQERLFLAQYDAPAYVRRGREVEGAYELLLARCRQQRDDWLKMARTRLGILFALAGDWETLLPLLADEGQLHLLRRLHDELSPRLRVAVAPNPSPRVLDRTLRGLCESLERFNRRWRAHLDALDLGPLNALRDGYNRYYVLEKECAMRSARLAREGFRRLEPLKAADVLAELPPLPIPVLHDE